MRMSSGPAAVTSSARATTWVGSRRSMPTILSRWIQSAAVLHGGEAAHRVLGEARRDRRVRAVAEQPQRDVHPDLGAATGEQGALAGEVGALVALGVRAGRAVGAEPVVERVDERVVGLADVAAARVDELAGEGAGGVGDQGDAVGLVVDAHRRSGGRRLDDLPVGLALGPRLRVAPVLLEPLVHQRRGPLEGLEVGVVDLERGRQVEHAHGRRDVLGVEVHDGGGVELVLGLTHRARVRGRAGSAPIRGHRPGDGVCRRAGDRPGHRSVVAGTGASPTAYGCGELASPGSRPACRRPCP